MLGVGGREGGKNEWGEIMRERRVTGVEREGM